MNFTRFLNDSTTEDFLSHITVTVNTTGDPGQYVLLHTLPLWFYIVFSSVCSLLALFILTFNAIFSAACWRTRSLRSAECDLLEINFSMLLIHLKHVDLVLFISSLHIAEVSGQRQRLEKNQCWVRKGTSCKRKEENHAIPYLPRTLSNLHVISLAGADMVQALGMILQVLTYAGPTNLRKNRYLCLGVLSTFLVSMSVTFLSIAFIAVDRYIYILFPFRWVDESSTSRVEASPYLHNVRSSLLFPKHLHKS
ncbi:hypothetical protein RRG08_042691 [Elysia crispata]|uniref:G-protein coupled receptors family 1 profile domain-containing protein n=1 Tax=Elysia crispata TaxID=231223 RepID=A0AAE0XQ24_9GAST|nr:hypothetical protein RRG08_042691 [Elysia crispata]